MIQQLTSYFKQLTPEAILSDPYQFKVIAKEIQHKANGGPITLTEVQTLAQCLKVLKRLVCDQSVSVSTRYLSQLAILESGLHTSFILIGSMMLPSDDTKVTLYQEHLLGFLANSVTASTNDQDFVESVLSTLFHQEALYQSLIQSYFSDIYTPLLVLLHNGFKRIYQKQGLLKAAQIEAIFNQAELDIFEREETQEWFTLLMTSLTNYTPFLYTVFDDKIKLLGLILNLIDETLERDKDPFSNSTIDELRDVAIHCFTKWQAEEDKKDSECLQQVLLILNIFCKIAAFGQHEYKEYLVKNNVVVFAMDFMWAVKEATDELERQGLWDPCKLKSNPLEEPQQHPFPRCNSIVMNLISTLTYMKSQQLEDYFQSPPGKLRLGLVLSYTRLDVDNPTLREWSVIVIRNLCSWSELVRKDLASLEFIGITDEGKKTLDELGMREAYLKEIQKLKRPNLSGELELDPSNFHVHTVDF